MDICPPPDVPIDSQQMKDWAIDRMTKYINAAREDLSAVGLNVDNVDFLDPSRGKSIAAWRRFCKNDAQLERWVELLTLGHAARKACMLARMQVRLRIADSRLKF